MNAAAASSGKSRMSGLEPTKVAATITKIAKKAKPKKDPSAPYSELFVRLSDAHRVLLGVAIRKYRLYSAIENDFETDHFDAVLDFVKKNIHSNPEKAVVKMYRDIEAVYQEQHKSLLKAPAKKKNGGAEDDRAQSC